MTVDALALANRIADRLAPDADPVTGCWAWQGTVVKGYGRYGRPGRYVHRLMWEAHFGEVPDGLVLDHLCNNRICANPYHLNPVTAAINTRRGAGRRLKADGTLSHCIRGHEMEGDNVFHVKTGHVRCRLCQRIRFRKWKDSK